LCTIQAYTLSKKKYSHTLSHKQECTNPPIYRKLCHLMKELEIMQLQEKTGVHHGKHIVLL
jgi:hypothetical protein